MTDRATSQSDNIVPPRRGEILCQAVDSTARPYQLAAIPIGGKSINNANQIDHVYVTLEADGADIFYQLSTATHSDLDDTAVNAAGTAWTSTTMSGTPSMASRILSGTSRDIRIQRSVDQWIILKTATGTTGTLRISASSQPEV